MRQFAAYTIMSAKAATGIGIPVFCRDFKHAVFSFATDGGSDAALTVKFQGSIAEGTTAGSAPDFSAAQSVTNLWDYIDVIDLEDGASIDGDTGVAVAGADDYRLFEANVNALEYICARVTARTEGEVTIKVVLYTD